MAVLPMAFVQQGPVCCQAPRCIHKLIIRTPAVNDRKYESRAQNIFNNSVNDFQLVLAKACSVPLDNIKSPAFKSSLALN